MNTERPESPAERALREYRAEVKALPLAQRDWGAIERRVQELHHAAAREDMAAIMKDADTDAPEVEIAGERWGNRRVTPGIYETIFGPVELQRSVYQRGGRGRVAVPLDLRIGIVEGSYTPRMARILSHATAVMTDEDGERLLHEVGTAMASKSTIHRVPRKVAARHEVNRDLIERAVREQDPIPEDTVTVQVGMDGVMVPQDGEHARRRGRKTDSPDPPRHELHYGPVGRGGPAESDGRTGRAWHEASVGTIAFFDAEGRRLKTTYIGRMPEPSKATLVRSLEDELGAVVAERPGINVLFASDGAPQHWSALAGMASRLPASFAGHTMNLVDAFHVAEYVKKAANAVEGADTPEANVLAAAWREAIKEQEGGVLKVLRSMRAQLPATETPAKGADLAEAIDYIDKQNKAGRMNYPEAKARHYPIGTGVTEAAAKTVVGTRMKRAGARFSPHGGQTVLLFRTALLSQRFEALHRELHASYTKPVKNAA